MGEYPKSVVSAFLLNAYKDGDAPAFYIGSDIWTYRVGALRMSAMAYGLKELGVKKGHTVVLFSGNSADWALCYFAIHAVGGVAVIIDNSTPKKVLAELIHRSESQLVVSDHEISDLSDQCVSFSDLVSKDVDDFVIPVCAPDNIADIMFTSGTTGQPKGIVLTHSNILSAAKHINLVISHGIGDVELLPIPLSHSFGLGRLRCMALAGNALSIEAGMNNAAATLMRLLEIKATGLAMVPAGFNLLKMMTGDRLSDAADHLRYIEIGSAPMAMEMREWLMHLFPNTKIYHHYGMTEASRSTFTEFHRDKDKNGTAGLPSPGVTINILGEDGRPVPTGETGEVVVSGGMVMKGYFKQSELTQKVFTSVGIRSNDLGYLDNEGYLYLVGRSSDMVNVGGLKVSPIEIENQLNRHPGVVESMCIGVPDKISGESLMVYLVCDELVTDDELINWLRGHIEEYKVPKHFQRVNVLPKTNSGKLKRQIHDGGKVL